MIEPAAVVRAGTLSAAGATDAGRVRTGNEDRMYVDVDRGIFLVVDGVGGHAAGEVAAAIAIDVIVQRLGRPTWSAEQRVREAIALANNEILKQADASPECAGMTCVLTLAIVADGRVTIGHVGDSRLYKLSPAGIVKLTHDHSPVGEREDALEMTEIEAMRHPRRNEVFRDVGSAFHQPDDADFVELIQTSFEPECALLLCSDGLSDMLPSAAIERIVRAQAGNPAAVAAALINAANEAGGRDNITVVYVEGDRFAATPKLTGRNVRPWTGGDPHGSDPAPGTDRTWSLMTAFGRAVIGSRGTWLTVGMVAGLVLGLGLALWPPLDPVIARRGRTLVVGPARDHYATVGAAVAAARPRDTVQIEPGDYMESVVVKDGVSLTARVPGTVTFEAPAGQAGFTSITAGGRLGGRISGIRVRGHADAPIAVGLSLSGHDWLVDDMVVEGAVGVGMDILNDGAIVVRASRFANVKGIPVRVGDGASPVLRNNLFVRGSAEEPFVALEAAASSTPELAANVFIGFGDPFGPAKRETLLRGNYFIRAPDHGTARTER